MKVKTLVHMILGILLMSSCSDFLEPQSQNEYIPKDANALQEMLIGSAYPKNAGGGYILSYLNFFDDDVQFHKTDYQFSINAPQDEAGRKALFTWQPDMFTIIEQNGSSVGFNIWEGYYSYILGANAALDYIDKVDGTDEEKNYVRAQALGLRGFYYFMLVNHFGEPYNYDKKALGVPLKLNSDLQQDDKLLMPRNTVEEVYNQVLADLGRAEELFAGLPQDKQYQPDYLVSMPMVELLLSRVYLYMENWDQAESYAQKVIKDWKFSLIDLNTLPSPTKAEPYYNFTSINSPEVIWTYGRVSDLTNLADVTVLKEEDGFLGKETYYRNAFIASDDLLSLFKDGDLRKDNYIVKEYDRSNSTFMIDSYLPYGKFNVTANGTPDGSENFALSFRLSEAYLNLAEAEAEKGEDANALATMNTLLEKRYEPGTYSVPQNLTKDELISFVRTERRKELCFEGQRWFDLRRYGMPQITHTWEGKTYTLKKDDPSYTMPIPDEVLRKNKLLEQNPLAPKRDL